MTAKNPTLPGQHRLRWRLHAVELILCGSLLSGGGPSAAQGAQRLLLSVAEEAGVARAPGHVTSGVPFPMGALKQDQHLRLLDEQGKEAPMQTRATATWRDGSVKWVLLDFQADVAARARRGFSLEYGEGVVRQAPAAAVEVAEDGLQVRAKSGPLLISLPRKETGLVREVRHDRNGDGAFDVNEAVFEGGLRLSLSLGKEWAERVPRVLPPEEVRIEEAGPLRALVKVTGWIDDGSTNRLFRYEARVQVVAASAQVRLFLTLTQLSDQPRPVWVRDLSLRWPARLPNETVLAGGQPTAHQARLGAGQPLLLTQLREGGYTVRRPEGGTEGGFHAPGWIEVANGDAGLLVACRHFWQQHPKVFSAGPESLRLGLYPAEAAQPFEWDQGLAKTHELLLDFHAGTLTAEQGAARATALEQPLFAVAPAGWYCDSKVFGDLWPFDFDRFPDYETLTDASGDQFVNRMTTGWRHWGDVYYGGEYKGTNSYTNLEYDMHHNFLCQFARTGLRKYLDPAFAMARHQADIDTNHKTGWQWKHSPRHVEIQAEFGHTFTRGLLETYYLNGDRRCLEAALELGNYFAREIRNPRSTGNERQIGWALISLLPVYEATWNRTYFDAASNTVERLLAGLDAKGKFDIRWDNRIAFFNGIAATGFLDYHRATGDERAAEAALRVMRRARGFYPEYNGRTLEAIAWACERTQEPAWFDFLARTWETTLARQISANVMELGAPTIFTVHALPFLARAGLVQPSQPPFRLTPGQFDSAGGLHARHLPAGEADLYLEVASQQPLDLAIIRKGAWRSSGTVTLFDPEGRQLSRLEFPRENVLWQRQILALVPKGMGAFRVAFRSPGGLGARGVPEVTWDAVTSRPVRGVVCTPKFRGLEFVTPRLYAAPSGLVPRIELEVAAEGEGFKRAVIYDPDGQVAGSVESFIDLGDRGRFFHKVSADIPPRHAHGAWSISLEGVTIEKLSGLTPYFSTSTQSFFRPDRPPEVR
jgi:hypothetical protein